MARKFDWDRALQDALKTVAPWVTLLLPPMSPLTPTPASPCSSTFHFSSVSPRAHTSDAFSPVNGSPSRVMHAKKLSLERKNSVLDCVHIAELELEWEQGTRWAQFASPAPDTTSSPDCQMADPEPLPKHKDQVVVVHTCMPCNPPISATQVEGILVYQTTLPLCPPLAHTTRTLLRRLDTDFVNLMPLLAAFSPCAPPALPPSAVRFDHPNSAVAGIWVSLDCAREFLRTRAQSGAETQAQGCPQTAEQPCSQDETLRTSVEVFLSDELVMRFLSALRDLWRASKPGRMLGQFGVCFEGGRFVGSQGSSSSSLAQASLGNRSSSPVLSPPQSTAPSSSSSSFGVASVVAATPRHVRFLRITFTDLEQLKDDFAMAIRHAARMHPQQPRKKLRVRLQILWDEILAMTYSDTELRGTLRYRLLSASLLPPTTTCHYPHTLCTLPPFAIENQTPPPALRDKTPSTSNAATSISTAFPFQLFDLMCGVS
ncbi:hypothetical protein DEU56DRAFT_963362 [Suillus clintonianus]|uniref:uncharacterized protein n=1 Tax=Suillus clintonianus TaxID=1904413 RepID=UPI001B87120A|nr:uncharacterized protein DEU56DRAFT_963362 [Suillus clintonianus]KAG2124673.1 hypothetical protein DEU56DRAFT_963362 [Suillus clintonianus]